MISFNRKQNYALREIKYHNNKIVYYVYVCICTIKIIDVDHSVPSNP